MEYSDYQGADAMNKINGFSSRYSYTKVMFQIEFLMEELDFVVAEEFKFKN